jgi:hypothetical protein
VLYLESLAPGRHSFALRSLASNENVVYDILYSPKFSGVRSIKLDLRLGLNMDRMRQSSHGQWTQPPDAPSSDPKTNTVLLSEVC